jgi:hypothetical protein
MLKKDRCRNSKEYIFSFYGKDEGIYNCFFDNKLTKEDVDTHFPIFMRSYNKLLEDQCGNSGYTITEENISWFDKEIFRDYLLVKLKDKSIDELEYKLSIKSVLLIEEQFNRRSKINHLLKKIDETKPSH